MSVFIKDLLERAVKTFVQVFAATLIIPVADVYNLAAWKGAVVAAGAAALSAVSSLISKSVGDKDTASLVPEVTAKPDA